MRREFLLATIAAMSAATGSFAFASGRVTEPRRGAVVTQVLPEQKAFFAQGLEAKLDTITAKEGHEALEAMPQHWGRPQPIRIAWEEGGAMPKNAAYVVKLIRTSDGKCVRTLKTKKTSVNVDSLEIATGYQVKVLMSRNGNETPVAESAFETEDYAPRLLNVGPVNARDLGGRIGLGGRRVRQGLVFRTAGLNRNSTVLKDASGAVTNFTVHPPSMSAESVSVLTNGYGVKTDLDLRNDEETYGMTGSPLGASVRFVHVPATWYGKYYASDNFRALFKRCFDVFLDDANYPILFHCSGGADRTGSLAFMLNALLGVSQKELDDDWIMTHYSLKWNPKPFTSKKHYLELLSGLKALEGASLAEKAATYCRQCGITDGEIERFREKMLEPLGAHLPQLEAGFANPPDDAKAEVEQRTPRTSSERSNQ